MGHVSPELDIHLLGPFRLLVDGEPVDSRRWSRLKAKQLLKLLALEPTRSGHRFIFVDLLLLGRRRMVRRLVAPGISRILGARSDPLPSL